MPRSHTDSLRVLVIAPTPFFADRGCHVRIYEQCRSVMREGHGVVICTYPIGRDVPGLEIRRSVRIPWYRKLSAGPSIHKLYVDPLLLLTVLRECVRRRPHVIHAHLHEGILIGWIASMLFRVPLVADLQGSLAGELVQHDFVREGGMLHRLFAGMERFLNRRPREALVSSAGTRGSLLGIDGRKAGTTHTLPDGVDPGRFYPDPAGGLEVRRRLGIGEHERVVGYLGVLSDYQGVSVLLQAAAQVLQDDDDVRFLLMGYPDEERYQRRAMELGIGERVIFTGRVDYAQARAHLSACDVAVSPKLSLTEANGKLLNYLAVGLPVIASDTPVNREILEGSGILTAPGESGALASAIMRVLADEGLRGQMRERALRRAGELSWDALAHEIVRIYRKAMGEESGARDEGERVNGVQRQTPINDAVTVP